MEIIYFPDDHRPEQWTRPVFALGNFDGLHRGHLKVIDHVRRRASERKGISGILIFDPHPSRVVRPDKAPCLLMTKEQRLESLKSSGIQAVAVVRFTPEMSRWEPEVFVKTVLVEWLRVAEIWVGENFLFGRDRTGNFSVLRSLGAHHGFLAEKIWSVRYKDFVVSSTRIRRLIDEGRVDEAGVLLGHHYYLEGVVTKGEGRGMRYGFPTANLITENELVPPDGVYASVVTLDSVIHPSVTNIGVRPTFGENGKTVIETHLFNFNKELYGQRLRLAFISRLRDEINFPDAETLMAQIAVDCEQAKKLFDQISL